MPRPLRLAALAALACHALAIPAGAQTTSRLPELDKALSQAPAQLTRAQAAAFAKTVVEADRKASAARGEASVLKDKAVVVGDLTMPFTLEKVGRKPAKGWPVILSLHGGGTAPKALNDGQWRNQQTRYKALLKDCVYIAPRGPRDREPWHPYMFPCLEKLIATMIRHGEADPDRIYLMGYSEGGYACFRVLPGLVDRFAGIAAGGAADDLALAPAENLAHVAFDLQVGELDTGYDRIGMARKYDAALAALKKANPGLFDYRFKAHAGAPHDCPDYLPANAAIPWLLKHSRVTQPKTLLLRQGRWSPAAHFYWLAIEQPAGDMRLNARVKGQVIELDSPDTAPFPDVRVRLSDELVNLDLPVEVRVNGRLVHSGKVARSASLMRDTWLERLDPARIYCAEIRVPGESFAR